RDMAPGALKNPRLAQPTPSASGTSAQLARLSALDERVEAALGAPDHSGDSEPDRVADNSLRALD
ncbi:MAG: hypothetical protein ABI212_02220, partial [Burkholderiaceae bacterium]